MIFCVPMIFEVGKKLKTNKYFELKNRKTFKKDLSSNNFGIFCKFSPNL